MFGPQSAPEISNRKYGSMYKLAWVPADLQLAVDSTKPTTSPRAPGQKPSMFSRIEKVLEKAHLRHPTSPISSSDKTVHLDVDHSPQLSSDDSSTRTRRACFGIDGDVGNTVRAQTVLPDLTDFKFDSIGACPHMNHEHRHRECELWKYTNVVGDRKNTYKMWVARNKNTGEAIPVHYYMLGYDSLLGSHYDRYDVSYFNYRPNAALDSDFAFDASAQKCGPMPGPGESASDAEIRKHLVVANPIHEVVERPHNYEHIDHEFGKFARDHGKEYESELHQRKGWLNFLHNFRFINGKNRELTQYKLKVNRFADSNVKDLSYLRGRRHSVGYNGGLDYEQHHNLKRSSGAYNDLPESFDWSIRGAVTPVKDQAVCGSCWSFGTTGAIEGANFVKTGKLIRLSQQQLVDCSWAYGNNACDGGEDFRAYKYIANEGGLASEEDYGSYLGVDGKCHDRDVPKSVKVNGFYNVTSKSEDALKHALITYGPVSVSIDASQPTFTFYSHGVYYDDKCKNSPDQLDHSVLVIGYAKIDGQFAWQVKNSWSTYWGNDGYILMSSKKNNCGVLDAPTVPMIV